MKKTAVVCAPGIGDALILHVASCQLQKQGYEVVTFSDHLPGFGRWLQGYRFAPQPEPALEEIERVFTPFDAVFLQHDNSPRAKKIKDLALPVYAFYGSHVESKHGPLRRGLDYVCDPDRTMVDNVVLALGSLFGIQAGKENGLAPFQGLIAGRHKKRIAIHPFSSMASKNWPAKKFLRVAERLQKEGWEPVWIAPPAAPLPGAGDIPSFAPLSLESLASFLYESAFFLGNDSGPGHLASCLGMPYALVAQSERHMRLWRPGWEEGRLLFPPRWIMEKYWKHSLNPRKVINSIKNMMLCN